MAPRTGSESDVWRIKSSAISECLAVGCGEDAVDVARRTGLSAKAHAAGQVALRIHVDEKHLPPLRGEGGRQVDDGRGLSHPAFLVCHRLYLVHYNGTCMIYWSNDLIHEACFGSLEESAPREYRSVPRGTSVLDA